MPPLRPTVSIIVPLHHGGASFRRCLSGLRRAVPAPSEIIVVADGESDGSWRVAEEAGATVLKLATRGGPARARNLGASAARGDILYFVDADVEIPRDAVGRVVSAFEREPELAAVFGSYDDSPGEPNFLSQYKNLLHHYGHQTGREEASTFWGACGAIRRDVFRETGGFDERYRWPSIEDIELGYRLRQAGYRIRLLKSLQVKHLKRWDVGSLLKSDWCHRALPWSRLILRSRGFINDLNVAVSGRVSVALTYGLLASLIGGWWWRGAWALTALLAIALLVLNLPLYRFFHRKRGLGFAIRTIPWHWFYFLYSGLAFLIGFLSAALPRRRPPTTA